jgi:hypothetical protein
MSSTRRVAAGHTVPVLPISRADIEMMLDEKLGEMKSELEDMIAGEVMAIVKAEMASFVVREISPTIAAIRVRLAELEEANKEKPVENPREIVQTEMTSLLNSVLPEMHKHLVELERRIGAGVIGETVRAQVARIMREEAAK